MDEFQTAYVTHDFIGENEDEISLKKGELVIVFERDEEFQDGWWRVCVNNNINIIYIILY